MRKFSPDTCPIEFQPRSAAGRLYKSAVPEPSYPGQMTWTEGPPNGLESGNELPDPPDSNLGVWQGGDCKAILYTF